MKRQLAKSRKDFNIWLGLSTNKQEILVWYFMYKTHDWTRYHDYNKFSLEILKNSFYL